jgi:hypothetical protein
MGISAKELAERLALSGPEAVLVEDSAEESEKLADKSLEEEEGKDESNETPVSNERPTPQPVRNAFSQLLPKIVALRDDVTSYNPVFEKVSSTWETSFGERRAGTVFWRLCCWASSSSAS